MKVLVKRIYDRGFRLGVKCDPDDEDDDNVFTKKKVQADLVALYTGAPFKGAKAYARMMSTIFVILIYSSGMPILYLVGVCWFTATYQVNKLLIVNYYQTTITMNRIIPQFSIKLLKVGLVCHMIIASLMLTNPEPFESDVSDGKPLIEFNAVKDIESFKKVYDTYKDDKFASIFLNRFKFLHQ